MLPNETQVDPGRAIGLFWKLLGVSMDSFYSIYVLTIVLNPILM